MRVGNNYSGARWAFSQRPRASWEKYAPGHYVKGDWHACRLHSGLWGLDNESPLGYFYRVFRTLKAAKAAAERDIYQESPAGGLTCRSCGASDSDE